VLHGLFQTTLRQQYTGATNMALCGPSAVGPNATSTGALPSSSDVKLTDCSRKNRTKTDKRTSTQNTAKVACYMARPGPGVKGGGDSNYAPTTMHTHTEHHNRLLYHGVSTGNKTAAGAQHGPTYIRSTSRDRHCPGHNTRGAYG
jgi:hypothetical protein